MAASEAKRMGLALAALVWDDREGRRARLTTALRAELSAALRTLDGGDEAHKTRVLRLWAERVRGGALPDARNVPARARGQLARHLPRDVGRRWFEGALPTRPDFSLERALRRQLLRSPCPDDANAGPLDGGTETQDAATHSKR